MGYYSAIKGDKLLIHRRTKLSEKAYLKMVTDDIVPFIEHSWNDKTIEMDSGRQGVETEVGRLVSSFIAIKE